MFLRTHIFLSDGKEDRRSMSVLAALEDIDDDCDRAGIVLVKVGDPETAGRYGIDQVPSLVYFEEKIPHLYQGD